MPERLDQFRDWLRRNFSPSLQYLYFMRFSAGLWVFPVVFLTLDMRVTTTLSRAIWVPEHFQGFACVSFFLMAHGVRGADHGANGRH
jgi:hypothetical protein